MHIYINTRTYILIYVMQHIYVAGNRRAREVCVGLLGIGLRGFGIVLRCWLEFGAALAALAKFLVFHTPKNSQHVQSKGSA